jgi:hypothetical protein
VQQRHLSCLNALSTVPSTAAAAAAAACLCVATGNTVKVTPESGGRSQSQSVSVPFTVDCDARLGISFNSTLQTQVTYAWSHTVTATGPTSVLANWGGTARVPAQAAFQRSVASATFSCRGSCASPTMKTCQRMWSQCRSYVLGPAALMLRAVALMSQHTKTTHVR